MKIGLIVLCGVALLLCVLNIAYSYLRKKLEKQIRDKFDIKEIIRATTRANFFGRQSKSGKPQ